jgi:hypothetical protein
MTHLVDDPNQILRHEPAFGVAQHVWHVGQVDGGKGLLRATRLPVLHAVKEGAQRIARALQQAVAVGGLRVAAFKLGAQLVRGRNHDLPFAVRHPLHVDADGGLRAALRKREGDPRLRRVIGDRRQVEGGAVDQLVELLGAAEARFA